MTSRLIAVYRNLMQFLAVQLQRDAIALLKKQLSQRQLKTKVLEALKK